MTTTLNGFGNTPMPGSTLNIGVNPSAMNPANSSIYGTAPGQMGPAQNGFTPVPIGAGSVTPQIQSQQQVPQTGLIGSEAALQNAGIGAFGQIDQGLGQANSTLTGLINSLNAATTQGNSMLTGGINQSQMATDRSLGVLQGARTQGLDAINSNFGQAVQGFQGFRDRGNQSGQLQAAMSGALGPAAQAEAFANFQDDPGTQFLRDRGEQGVLRNAAATGGLQGGNVLKELGEFNQGLALQSLSQRQDQLGQVAGRGLQAEGQVGQLRGQQGQSSANLIGQLGQSEAGTIQDGSRVQSALTEAQSRNVMQGANLGAQLGQNQASNEFNAGAGKADILMGLGELTSQGRTNAGLNIADSISSTVTGLSTSLANEGININDILGGDQAKIEDIINNLTTDQAATLQQLAAVLGNLSTGTANTVAGLPGVPGVQQTDGNLDDVAQIAAAVATLSDIRMKENIKSIGANDKGFNLYTWDWTEEGKALSNGAANVGVLAQEVQKTHPEIVTKGSDGFLRVDYTRIN